MLNMLRAILFRLRKSGALIAAPLAAVAVFAIFGAAELEMGFWNGRWASGETYDPTFLGLAGRVAFGSVPLLPCMAGIWCVQLFVDDIEGLPSGAAMKNVIVRPRGRPHYLCVQLMVMLASCIVSTVLLLVVCAWLPGAWSVETPPVDAASVAAWAALAALTAFCFCSIALCACMFARSSRIAWVLAFAICYGIVGKLLMLPLALFTMGGGASAALEMSSMLPSTHAYVLGEGLGYFSYPGAMFKVVFYPLLWSVIAALVAYARLRRRSF